MLFEKHLLPDLFLAGYREVTPELLSSLGKTALICDIDNTLVTYDDPEPTDELNAWLRDMAEHGIAVAFVSNNNAERVERFNASLGYTAYSRSGKPSPRFVRRAAADMGRSPGECVLLGDQLLTDAAAGHSAGMYVMTVPPINDKTTLFWRIKRAIERPYMRRYHSKAEGSKK